ncbi:hypothetical protein ACLKA7_014919 [Drosophila subpalustris]
MDKDNTLPARQPPPVLVFANSSATNAIIDWQPTTDEASSTLYQARTPSPSPSAAIRPKSVNPITCSSAGIFCDMFHNCGEFGCPKPRVLRFHSHCGWQRMLRWPHTTEMEGESEGAGVAAVDKLPLDKQPTQNVPQRGVSSSRLWHSLTRVYLASP